MELRARPVEHSRADVLLAWLSRGGNGGLEEPQMPKRAIVVRMTWRESEAELYARRVKHP